MRRFLISISVALLLFSGSATAALPQTRAQATMQKISQREPVRSAVWGVFAVNMQGDTLVNINSRQKMVPASNVKLLTTGLALRTLGSDFRFETGLGYVGTITDSTLVGDLYIIGGGDPTTGSASEHADKLNVTFARWASIIRKAGINRIDGRVIGKHRGYWNYTVGMRKGLGIGGGTPYYVVALDAARNRVIVGFKDDAVRYDLELTDTVGTIDKSLPVKVRSAGEPRLLKDGIAGIAPGQSAVFYDGDAVVGGGIITQAG